MAAQASVQVLERPDMMAGYQNIFIAITLIVAMFMGCTFNAMNLIHDSRKRGQRSMGGRLPYRVHDAFQMDRP